MVLMCGKISENSENWSNDRVLCTALEAGWVGGWLAALPPPPSLVGTFREGAGWNMPVELNALEVPRWTEGDERCGAGAAGA